MGRYMSYQEAAEYAAQWGATDSPGAIAAYNLSTPGALDREGAAALREYVQGECRDIAERGSCCGLPGRCESDLAELERLAVYLAVAYRLESI